MWSIFLFGCTGMVERGILSELFSTMPVHPNRKIDHIDRHVVNQGSRTPVQASAGCDKYAKKASLNILQINISGLQNKTVELEKRLHEEQIHVVLLQENI